MISKDNFIKVMNKLKQDEDYDRALNEVFRKYNPDTQSFCDNNYTIIVEMLLPQLINLERCDEVVGDLNYFCLELEFGEKYEPGMVLDKDGSNVHMGTIEKFWNYLKKEYMTENLSD